MKLLTILTAFALTIFPILSFAQDTSTPPPLPTPKPIIELIPVIYGETDYNLVQIFEATRANKMIIEQGNGGEVAGMFATLKYLEAHPEKKIIIDGFCASACTMLLSKRLKNVCFTKQAEFYFHSVYTQNEKTGKKTMDPASNKVMYEEFDTPLQFFITASHAYGSLKLTKMDVDTAQSLTFKGC